MSVNVHYVCISGALLKAVCVCSDLVCVSSPVSLKEQLLQRWGGGLEIHSCSSLPHGSGLGEDVTSDLLHRLNVQ